MLRGPFKAGRRRWRRSSAIRARIKRNYRGIRSRVGGTYTVRGLSHTCHVTISTAEGKREQLGGDGAASAARAVFLPPANAQLDVAMARRKPKLWERRIQLRNYHLQDKNSRVSRAAG